MANPCIHRTVAFDRKTVQFHKTTNYPPRDTTFGARWFPHRHDDGYSSRGPRKGLRQERSTPPECPTPYLGNFEVHGLEAHILTVLVEHAAAASAVDEETYGRVRVSTIFRDRGERHWHVYFNDDGALGSIRTLVPSRGVSSPHPYPRTSGRTNLPARPRGQNWLAQLASPPRSRRQVLVPGATKRPALSPGS